MNQEHSFPVALKTLLILMLIAGFFIYTSSLFATFDSDKNADDESKSKVVSKTEVENLLNSVKKMVYKGHVFLAGCQNPDGSFSVNPESLGYAKSAPIAVTALTCLSFMAGGNTPARGEFRGRLKKGLSYLLSVCDPDTGEFHDDGDTTSKMHGQGFAMLALAEAYGMFITGNRSADRERIGSALRKSVALVSKIQTEVGGWYYDAKFSSEHEGSITICIVEALRAARNAGIHVDKGVIDKAVNYVRRSQKRDGSFRYRLNDDNSSYALTAAGVATLNATGEYDSKAVDLGIEYMQKKDPILNLITFERYPHYGRFYASQAYYQFKNLSLWNRWYPRFIKECKALQYADGSYPNQTYGSVYSTAMLTLTLQVSFGYLPIFQR